MFFRICSTILLLSLFFFCLFALGFLSASVEPKKQESQKPTPQKSQERNRKKWLIQEEDRDYFVSTVIDYYCDDPKFLNLVDSLPEKQVKVLYQMIEAYIEDMLIRCKRSFPTEGARDGWVIQKMDQLRRKIIAHPLEFIQANRSRIIKR